ncbi:hypothetical protein FOMPIDRAFT_1042264 [Fomitopsis schrenkii]|uniref:Uncharacterized protein n=1 Tax=Fomitopsis schrenkii TaxID=2126942 RepID=S8FBS6_FOMSC|nr:hypothetical protein FOMPIDRAFT_1042264 [Fomitopsis schrenkii]
MHREPAHPPPAHIRTAVHRNGAWRPGREVSHPEGETGGCPGAPPARARTARAHACGASPARADPRGHARRRGEKAALRRLHGRGRLGRRAGRQREGGSRGARGLPPPRIRDAPGRLDPKRLHTRGPPAARARGEAGGRGDARVSRRGRDRVWGEPEWRERGRGRAWVRGEEFGVSALQRPRCGAGVWAVWLRRGRGRDGPGDRGEAVLCV